MCPHKVTLGKIPPLWIGDYQLRSTTFPCIPIWSLHITLLVPLLCFIISVLRANPHNRPDIIFRWTVKESLQSSEGIIRKTDASILRYGNLHWIALFVLSATEYALIFHSMCTMHIIFHSGVAVIIAQPWLGYLHGISQKIRPDSIQMLSGSPAWLHMMHDPPSQCLHLQSVVQNI